MLQVAELLTTLSKSSRHPTFDFLNFCFRSPKHQSGANLVWPTIMNDISIFLLSPDRTLHARYSIMKLLKRPT